MRIKRAIVITAVLVVGTWAVLSQPTATAHPNTHTFEIEGITATDIDNIHGISATIVYAASPNSGVFQYQPSTATWTLVTGEKTACGLRVDSVFVLSATRVYAGGKNPINADTPKAVCYYDGTTWTLTSNPAGWSGNNAANAMFGFGETDIFFGDLSGDLYRGGAAGWTKIVDNPAGTNQVNGLWGTAANNVWWTINGVSGANDVCNWNGSTATCYAVSGIRGLNRVWGTAANNVWFGGTADPVTGAAVVRWDGSTFGTVTALPSGGTVQGLWGLGASNIYATTNTASNSELHHYDGSTWQTANLPMAIINAAGLWGVSETAFWVGGQTDDFVTAAIMRKTDAGAAIPFPSLTGYTFEPDSIEVSVSQAQCSGDRVSLSFVVDTTGGTYTTYVIDTRANTVVEVIPIGGYSSLNDRLYYASKLYAPGEYVYLVRADYVVVSDIFDTESFSVPANNCASSAGLISAARAEILAEIAGLNTTVVIAHNHHDAHLHEINFNVTQVNMSIQAIQSFLSGNLSLENITINGTSIPQILSQSMNPIADRMDGFFWLFAIIAAIAWAERTKDVFYYVLAILTIVTVVLLLTGDFVWLRLPLVGSALLLAARAYYIYERNDEE